MLCKKHPKYQAKRYPWSKCSTCLRAWMSKNSKEKVLCKKHPKANSRWESVGCDACSYLFHKRCVDSLLPKVKKDLRKSTPEDEHMPCDARAYAERYDFGNHDPERI